MALDLFCLFVCFFGCVCVVLWYVVSFEAKGGRGIRRVLLVGILGVERWRLSASVSAAVRDEEGCLSTAGMLFTKAVSRSGTLPWVIPL